MFNKKLKTIAVNNNSNYILLTSNQDFVKLVASFKALKHFHNSPYYQHDIKIIMTDDHHIQVPDLQAGPPREISGPGAKISFGPLGQWCSKIKR